MKKFMTSSFSLFALFIFVLFMSSCVSYTFNKDKPLVYNNIQITIDDIRSGSEFTNYFIYVKIKNIGNREMVFDSGKLELVDNDSGLTFYSISKDKSSISVPIEMSDLITMSSIKPGRMIAGMLWFSTQTRQATASKLRLYFGNKYIDFIRK